jgi:hypothetical protein
VTRIRTPASIPPREVLLTLSSVVHRARLDAEREVEDLRSLPEGAHSDHHTYWLQELGRLQAGHAWLLDLLRSPDRGQETR